MRTPSPYDYPEDAADTDNGRYFHICTNPACKAQFTAHKRRHGLCKVCSTAEDAECEQRDEYVRKAGLDPDEWIIMPRKQFGGYMAAAVRCMVDANQERALRRDLVEALKVADSTNSNVAYWGHPGRHRDTSVALIEKAREMDERLKAREEEGKP